MKPVYSLVSIFLLTFMAHARADTPIEINPKEMAAIEKAIKKTVEYKHKVEDAARSRHALKQALKRFRKAETEDDRERWARAAENQFVESVERQLDPLEGYAKGLKEVDHKIGTALAHARSAKRDMARPEMVDQLNRFTDTMGAIGKAMRRYDSPDLRAAALGVKQATRNLRMLVRVAKENRSGLSKEMLQQVRAEILTAQNAVYSYIAILRAQVDGIVRTRSVSSATRISRVIKKVGFNVEQLTQQYVDMRPIREWRTGGASYSEAEVGDENGDPYDFGGSF